MPKTDLTSMTLPALTEWVTGTLGEPKFRAGQIYRWVHQKRVDSFGEMTNLSAALRQKLEDTAFLTTLTTRRRLESRLDETVKLLLELPDRNCVEAVLMRYEHGLSLCISTQVGCRMGCKFCASTLGGLVRSLTPAEMLGEVYEAERQAGEPISSLVPPAAFVTASMRWRSWGWGLPFPFRCTQRMMKPEIPSCRSTGSII